MQTGGDTDLLIVLAAAGRRFGCWAENVVEIRPIVATTPLTPPAGIDAPPAFEGLVNVRGEIVPTIDARAVFGVERRRVHRDDVLVILASRGRMVGLRVDAVDRALAVARSDLRTVDVRVADATHLVDAVGMLDGDVIVIHDPDAFLSAADHVALAALIERVPADNVGNIDIADGTGPGDAAILRQRAATLAEPVRAPEATHDDASLILHAGDNRFALPLGAVRRVLPPGPLTPLRQPYHQLLGVRAAQHDLVAVADVATLVGQPATTAAHGHVVVLDGDAPLGLLAYDVGIEYLRAPANPDDGATAIRGVAPDGTIHLDPAGVLAHAAFAPSDGATRALEAS